MTEEKKLSIEKIKDQTTSEHFNIPSMDYKAMSNGVKCGNIKQRELEAVWTKVTDRAVKQWAIEFAKWCLKEGWADFDGVDCWINIGKGKKAITTEELYQLFIATSSSRLQQTVPGNVTGK